MADDAPAFPVHSLQVEALQREQNRIDARRARNAERAKRFNSGKRRNVSVETLARQIAHNDSRRDEERELDKRYAVMAERVSLIVEERRQADLEQRQSELQALKQDWDRRSTLPKNDLPKLASASELEPGKAAAQSFVGEDPSAPRRKLRQHAQMRTWSLEQMALKEAHKNDGKEEDRRFAAWERHVSQQRAQVEAAEKRAKAEVQLDLRAARDRQVADRKQREWDDAVMDAECNACEMERMRNDPMLNEAREYLADGRVRPDHYRGLTKAQVIGVYAENEAVEKYRKEVNEGQFDEGAQFRAESDHVNVLVAAAEYHAQNEKLRERLDVQEHLQKMMLEERERKEAIARDRFGAIEEGVVLSGFGKSYR